MVMFSAMDHLIDAVTTSSSLVHSIVSGVMETTTNQFVGVRRRLLEAHVHDSCGTSDAGSTDSADNQFLILTEDHFSELADEDLDTTGVLFCFFVMGMHAPNDSYDQLPIDQKDVERAIRRYIKLIRCEETDSEKKRKLIVKLCELRIRLSQMMEELDEKYLNGHRFNNKPHLQSSSSVTCDVCLKRQSPILLPSAIFKTYQPNFVLSCDFCDFRIHRNCMTSVSTKDSSSLLHQVPDLCHCNCLLAWTCVSMSVP